MGSTEKKDTSTQTSDPIETQLLVWHPPLWGPRGRRTKWPDCQGKEQLTEEGTEAGRSLMKREKSTRPRTDPCGTPRRTRKERLL